MSGGQTIVIDTPEDRDSWPSAHQGERCKCGDLPNQVFVKKDGRNRGKEFYACPAPQGQQCGYFTWGGKYRDTNPPVLKRARTELIVDDGGASEKRSKEVIENQEEIKAMLIGVQNQLMSIEKYLDQ
jgi:hypothetical protein